MSVLAKCSAPETHICVSKQVLELVYGTIVLFTLRYDILPRSQLWFAMAQATIDGKGAV